MSAAVPEGETTFQGCPPMGCKTPSGAAINPEIIVASCGVDACMVRNGGDGALVLSPDQTYTSAVAAVSRVLPCWPAERVEALVGEHLGTEVDLDLDEVIPGYSTRWVERVQEPRSYRWTVLALVVLAAIAMWVGMVYAFDLPHLLPYNK